MTTKVSSGAMQTAVGRSPTWGVSVFSIGILLGLLLSGVAIWGDLEATLFDRNLSYLRDASLKTLRCPVLMTTKESGSVTATFRNPLDRPVQLLVRAHVSQFLTLMREDVTKLALDPGETAKLVWTVHSDDMMYGHLIFVKVLQHRQYPMPGRLGSCGIVVLDLPYFTGGQIVAFALVASLLSMAGGLALWISASRPLNQEKTAVLRAMGVLGGSVLVGLVASFLGLWLLGLVVLVVALILVVSIVGHSLSRSSPD